MKLALIGYGKMGHMIEQVALSRGHEIVCIIDVDNLQDFDSTAFKSAEVAIEFTAPTAAYNNVKKAIGCGVKVVSGSTGWFAQHEDEMNQLCQQGGTLLWASNFSLGVNVFRAVNRYLARIIAPFGYTPTLTETHHIHKLDHPSGTGITLAEELVAEVPSLTGWQFGQLTQPDGTVEGTTQVPQDKIRVDSIRRDEVPGIHTISWNSEADEISITHDAHSRQGFALGAVLAAEYVAQHQGRLSIDDVFAF